MTARTAFPLRILSSVCIALAPVGAVAQNSAPQGLSGFFNNLAAGLGNQQAQEQIASAAAADGMQLLARLMEQNGYDRRKAWTTFFQSPEGQRVARTPGALRLLTDWFNAVMALPSAPQGGVYPAQVQPKPSPQQPSDTNTQSADQVEGNLTPPFLGPYRPNAYGPGVNSDATGRPFVWQPDQGPADPLAQVRPDVFGPGIGMDQYGRPVRAACPPFQQSC